MPRYISRSYHVEAVQWSGYKSSIPIGFAEQVIPTRLGMGCDVRCGSEIRPCSLGDWLVLGIDGRIDVLPNGVFDQRFEAVHAAPATADYKGVTGTFIGNPHADPDQEPPFVDWLGMRFPRGKAMPLAHMMVSDIEKIRLNSHFVVTDPEPEPVEIHDAETRPSSAPKRETLTLTTKGHAHAR